MAAASQGATCTAAPAPTGMGSSTTFTSNPCALPGRGKKLLIASAGANQVFGDGDDVTSDQAQDRYQPSTLAKARAEAETRAAKRKK